MKDSVPEWMARLKARDELAAREVFRRFVRRLIALAHRRLDPRFRHRVDPQDIVQSAYKSFFRRYGEGELEITSWSSLWALLTVITVRKCADKVTFHRADRRDVGREVSGPPGADAETPGDEALGREPTPLEAAMLGETIEQLVASLEGDERQVLELSLQGYTTPEISERLGRPERTVRRVRERIRNRLERVEREGF